MSALVIDASTGAAALFQEPHTNAARTLFRNRHRRLVPGLFYSEMANIIWKRHNRGEVTPDDTRLLFKAVLALRVERTSTFELAESALKIAIQTRRSAYDCVYLALAVKSDAIMVTADQRLVNALAGGPFEKYVSWIGRGIG